MKKTLFTVFVSVSILLAAPASNTVNESAAIKKIGDTAARQLLKTLGGNLKKHLKAGGPKEALRFCAGNAYTLTDKVDKSLGDNISVKRISRRYRNPLNAPDSEETAVLRIFDQMKKNRVAMPDALVQNLGNGTYKYYKPLMINKHVCLKCHGNVRKDDPELYTAIKSLYPDDRAMNYSMGDLRGAIVVEIRR